MAYIGEREGLPESPEDVDSLLSIMQKGEMELRGCSVVVVNKVDEQLPNRFRITSPGGQSLEVGCRTDEIAKEWADAVRQSVNQLAIKEMSKRRISQVAMQEQLSIALSDLIIYCQATEFDRKKRGPPEEMASLSETKAEKKCSRSHAQDLNRYNQRQLTRIYPNPTRLLSSNYDPTPMWMAGCQLTALNFQTADLPMQLNHGLFLANGGSGYILKPEFMSKTDYDPYKQHNLMGVEPLSITITILSARHLPMQGENIPSPYIEINIHGCAYDSQFNSFKTSVNATNGLNPEWVESCVFDILNPELALIRFAVLHPNVSGDPSFLAQATYPVRLLRSGYRSVPLKNGYSEEIPLAALLIHLEFSNPKDDYEDIYMSIQDLQKEMYLMQDKIKEYEDNGNKVEAQRLCRDMQSMKRKLSEKKTERSNRIKAKKRQKEVPDSKE